MTVLLDVMRRVAQDVRDRADELNALDGAAGDGDLGVTMSAASDAILDLAPELDRQPVSDVLVACGTRIAREAPSTCGTLVATALLAAGRAAASDENATLAGLLEAGRAAIADRGKAESGDKTMLDALVPPPRPPKMHACAANRSSRRSRPRRRRPARAPRRPRR